MRSILKAFALIGTFALGALANPLPTELDVIATATFPADNPFNKIVNGQRNLLQVEIENKSPVNITLKNAAGSFHDANSGKLIKNTTAATYGVTLISGAKTVLPYTFHSENKVGDANLKIWVSYDDGNPSTLHRAVAFDGVVGVVEPKGSLIDIPLLFSYIVLAALVGGAGYYIYQNFVPKSKSRKAKKHHINKSEITAPVGPVTTTIGGKSYDEDWIPGHLKKKGKKEPGAASSGDESGPERRKTRRTASQKAN